MPRKLPVVFFEYESGKINARVVETIAEDGSRLAKSADRLYGKVNTTQKKLGYPEAEHLIDLLRLWSDMKRAGYRGKQKPVVREYCEKRNRLLPGNKQLNVESVYRQFRRYLRRK